MNFDYLLNVKSCFDFVTIDAPMSLVYYSHFSSIIVSLILGLIVLRYSYKLLTGKLLFALSLVFSLWVIFDLITWTSYNSLYYMFFWSFLGLLTVLIYLISIYFAYSFVYNKNIPTRGLFASILLMLPVIIFTPTVYNLSGFSDIDCISIESPIFTNYYHFFGILAFISILIIAIKGFLKSTDKSFRKQIVLMTVGIESFIFVFFTATYLDSYFVAAGITGDYLLGNYGLFGIIIFMAMLVFLIVKFKAFEIKLIGAQALVWGIAILVGSQLFFIKSYINVILTSITLVITVVAGYVLVRSVKSEITQKERIEVLAKNLEISNSTLETANDKLKELDSMKSEFVSLATHQIRGPLAAIKGYVSLMIEGDYGEVPQPIKEPLQVVFKSTDSLSNMVTDFLDVSRLDLGQMKYDFTNFDFRDLVNEVVKEFKPSIDAKGLEFRIKITDSPCPIKADRVKLKQVLNNLVDNSNKYTKSGWLEISVEKKGDKVLFAVKDSGVGISEKTMAVLFQRFSRAKNANDANILGTGLGLYIAKKMAEANDGRVWAESEGDGKGAQFYVELKLVE